MEKKIKEYRTSEVRSADDGDKLIVEGYAAVFDSPTLIFESINSPNCILRNRPDSFAEQNGRGAERADTL